MTKLINLIKEETKTSKIMKNPEINALALGQFMCLSALIESEAYKTGNLVNSDVLMSLTSSMIHLYQTYDFLHESIQTAFSKLIQSLPLESHGTKVFEKVVAELLIANKNKDGQLQDFLFAHMDNLCLFFTLKHLYINSKIREQSPKLAKVLGLDIFGDDSNLHKLKVIIGRSIHIYPRLHNCLPMLINEIYLKHASSSKLRQQEILKLSKAIFEEHFFDEEVYHGIKNSSSRPKFLHIGLKFWELVGMQTLARESKVETKRAILNALISEGFLRVFVRGVSFQKGVLFDVANEVKGSLVKMLQQVEVSAEHAMQLLQTLFGPNTSNRLAIKRNQDLLKAIASKMDAERVTEYLNVMHSQFVSPFLQEHYGDEAAPDKEQHRIGAIRAFSMAQLASAPSIFRHCLSSAHVSQCLTSLIPIAFSVDDSGTLRTQAQYKLFTMIELLQKIKLGDGGTKKGFVEGSSKLWLAVANAKINNLIKQSEETVTIAKQQKRILKFVKQEVTPLRIKLFGKVADEATMERRMRFEVEAKRTLAIEKLILSLSLTMCVPGVDLRDVTDTHEQIEDLIKCFAELQLGQMEPSNKKAKKEKSQGAKSTSQSRVTALSVLFDLLIAQLTKSQSFLREMANYVFKQFCDELDEQSLDHLLDIVCKPAAQNDELSESEEEDSSDEDASDLELADDQGDAESDSEDDQ